MLRGRAPRWGRAVLAIAVATSSSTLVGAAPAHARADKPLALGDVLERLSVIEETIVAAERAGVDDAQDEEKLAKQLVRGQLMLGDGDFEGAAIVFLGVTEGAPNSAAAAQAMFFLGQAAVGMDLPRWGMEMFSAVLADSRASAKRLQQRAIAELLRLATPSKGPGFAREPGLSATPEARARLESLGVHARGVPVGIVQAEDEARLVRWVRSVPSSRWEPELRYAYGRYLFLRRHYKDAIEVLEPLDPPPEDPELRAPTGRALQAGYLIAASLVAAHNPEDAIARFEELGTRKALDSDEAEIIDLCNMAIGRIQHDAKRWEQALTAYARIGRSSTLFSEALYETAWTLMRAGRHDRALTALELLLQYAPNAPVAAEVRQLRGKVAILRRDYPRAEEAFVSMREEFSALQTKLRAQLTLSDDAVDYYAAVVDQDLEHFDLAGVIPVEALPLARGMRRAVGAEVLAQEQGGLRRTMADLRAMLARMEEALQARQRSRLFRDLAAHMTALDNSAVELVKLRSALTWRYVRRGGGSEQQAVRTARDELLGRIAAPLGQTVGDRRALAERIESLGQAAHRYDLGISAARGTLVATERYYEQTRNDQHIDHQKYLDEAAALRDEIAEQERDAAQLRRELERVRARLRYDDPWQAAQDDAVAAARDRFAQLRQTYGTVYPDADADVAWDRVVTLDRRLDAARAALERDAGARLKLAVRVIEEERANLGALDEELQELHAQARPLLGTMVVATLADVAGELHNLVMRSEVGLLDVAWSMKEFEQSEVERLERRRSAAHAEIADALDMGLGDLE